MSESTAPSLFEKAIQIISALKNIRPYSSFSFALDETGVEAIEKTIILIEEKFPKNMTNLRNSALDTLKPLSQNKPNTPLNVNLTEEDIKSLEKVEEILERAA